MKEECEKCGSWYNPKTSKRCPACHPHWNEKDMGIASNQVTGYIRQTTRGMARSGQRRRPGKGWKIV